MSRADGKRHGHFGADAETRQILKAMDGWQSAYGDTVAYYRLDIDNSQWDDVFEEATGPGRVYHPPVQLPVMHVTYIEGESKDSSAGRYVNDSMMVTVSYKAFIRAGMSNPEVNQRNYLPDRLVYRNRVFRILSISVEGQIRHRNTIVSIDCSEMEADELQDDPQFAKWVADESTPDN